MFFFTSRFNNVPSDFPGAPEPSTFGDQLAWLEKDLRVANSLRDVYPWILVAGHRPIYSSIHGYSEDGKPIKESKRIQEAMEELFHKYKVDLYICGHVHSYERIYPTYKSEVKSQTYHNPEDTAYVVIGTGGLYMTIIETLIAFFFLFNELIYQSIIRKY